MYQFVLAIPRHISDFSQKFKIKPISIKYFKLVSIPGHISDLYLLNISIDVDHVEFFRVDTEE